MSRIKQLRARIKCLNTMKVMINIVIQSGKEMRKSLLVKSAKEYLVKVNLSLLEAHEALKLDASGQGYELTIDALIYQLHLVEIEGAKFTLSFEPLGGK